MIGRLARWVAVRYGAWALRRGMTVDQIALAIARSFGHRDEAWRSELLEDMRRRNRDRTMREIDA